MKQRKKVIFALILMAFLSFSCLTISISYAFLSEVTVSNNTKTITTGNLNATVTYTPNNAPILSTMSDAMGLNQTDLAEISISKNNVYNVFYTVDISYSVSSIPITKSTSDLVPLEFVRVALFNDDSSIPIVGPVSITDLPLMEVDESSVYNDKYALSYGLLSAGRASETLSLKAWLDPAISSDYDASIIYLEMHLNQETAISKSFYNISGIVSQAGSPVSGAVVKLQNGLAVATTSATGAYTLSNVPEGTYALTVTSGSTTYETSLNIRSGQNVSLSTVGPSTASAGTYLQNSAFTYFTTPGQILRNNSLTTTTNEVSSTTYSVPNSYVLTGLESVSVLSIPNVNIALSGTSTTTLNLG